MTNNKNGSKAVFSYVRDKMTKIAVIDYGFGNIKSVLNALNFCEAEAFVITEGFV